MKNNSRVLLSVGHDAKTIRGIKYNVLTGILYLAPHKEAGKGNLCAHASKECAALCLYSSGRARIFPQVKKGRIRKTHFLFEDPKGFDLRLRKDVEALVRKANREGLSPACRVDGTSDIGLGVDLSKDFPEVNFYDYTKNPKRMRDFLKGNLPSNYHLTFSRSGKNDNECEEFLNLGGGVAMVFQNLPETYLGRRVIDADLSDLRYMDREIFGLLPGEGYIAGLRPKGIAKDSVGKFVIH